MELKIKIDDELANNAQHIFDTIGIDIETAVRMFLKRTVLEQRLPLNTSITVANSFDTTATSITQPKRTNTVITKAMVEDIWKRFLKYMVAGGNINSIAAAAHEATGMNQGSAFIYITILDNLINGKHNTRNMKMADLEFYMNRIKHELEDQFYRNAITSLKLSIPYWTKNEFGQFASKVQAYLDSTEGVRQ
jgi:addiction module RelB/DinJ family antitoxin